MRILNLNDIKRNVAIIYNRCNKTRRVVSNNVIYVCQPIKNEKTGQIKRTYIVKAQIVYNTNTIDESQGTYYWKEIEKLNYNDSTKIVSKNPGGQIVADKLFNNLCICIGKTWNKNSCEKWPNKFKEFIPTYDDKQYMFETYEEAEQYINDIINNKIQCPTTTNNYINYEIIK